MLRAASLQVGGALQELDLCGSRICVTQLEILLARVLRLRVLRICGCDQFDANCASVLTRVSGRHVTELYADHCALFRVDPLLILGGCIGFNAPRLNNITVLSLANCPLEDKGIAGISNCCKHIQFLNLCDCNLLTDDSLCILFKKNIKLEVLNLSGCNKLTNTVILALANHCNLLQSLNIAKCNKISDKSIIPLLKNCNQLQALNLAGLRLLSELVICTIAEYCKDILCTLNITGCDKITANGLDALIEGFIYVQRSSNYVGFHPIDNYLEFKLQSILLLLFMILYMYIYFFY